MISDAHTSLKHRMLIFHVIESIPSFPQKLVEGGNVDIVIVVEICWNTRPIILSSTDETRKK